MKKDKDPGRIITFYSYKGGTGRSMAVANVAWLMAAAGKNVLMVDWDLEAPGLHRYIHPFLDDPELTSSEGVIDFVISYTEEVSSKNLDEKLGPKWFAPYANINRFAIPLDYQFPNGGMLDFIPAGKQGSAYGARVNSFNWRDFYVHLGGRAVIKEAQERMRERYEYVLIDSRTGVSDTSGICTVELPDDVVVCFTLNMQSVTGAAGVVRSMQEQRPTDPLHIFPVAMRVEAGEKDKTDVIRTYAKGKFLDLMSDMSVEPDARDRYWHDVEVPQIPFYAFEEQLAYFKDSPNERTGVLASMKWLVWHLTKVDVRDAPGPDPAIRDGVLARYAGVWSAKPETASAEAAKKFIYVSYNDSSLPSVRFTNSISNAINLPAGMIPGGEEILTAANLSRSVSWIEAFRNMLGRCKAMYIVDDERGVSPLQQRELAVALDHQSRVGKTEFPITAVSSSGRASGQFLGLSSDNGKNCPYPGLRPFNTEDAAVFFGHEVFLEKLAEQMATTTVLVLGGKPGTGKTSAIKAGLIPRLLVRETPKWKVVLCSVTGEPLACIAEALVRAGGTAQFESKVQQDLAALMARLPREGAAVLKDTVGSVLSAWPAADRIAVIIEAGASRLDSQYLKSIFSEMPTLSFVVVTDFPDPVQITLPVPAKDDLVQAIEKPAQYADCSVEAGLAARIAADLGYEEDPLALLQLCMTEVWSFRAMRAAAGEACIINEADYAVIGGVGNAVKDWAEASLNILPVEEQTRAIQLMCQMVAISDPGTLRAPQPGSGLLAEADRRLLEKLVDAGLVTKNRDTADTYSYSLFHPRLALRWPRLQAAVARNADFLRWREGFRFAVQAYSVRPSYSALLRDDSLAEAQRWREQRPGDFTQQELDFIKRSEESEEEEQARRKSLSWRGQWVPIAIAVSVVALVIALIAWLSGQKPAPPSAISLVTEAYQDRQSGNFGEALNQLTQALKLNPSPQLKAQIYSDLAYSYKLAGDWNNSLGYLNMALAENSSKDDKIRLLNDRTNAYVELLHPEAALADSTAVLELDPGNRIAIPNKSWLGEIFKPTTPTRPGTPPLFVFVKFTQPPVYIEDVVNELPAAVRNLYPRTVPGLNVRQWPTLIPQNELRYSNPSSKPLALTIAGQLSHGDLARTEPQYVKSSGSPRVELWLATKSQN